MKRTAKWMKHLTIAELKHMKELQDTLSLRSFLKNRKAQKEWEAKARADGFDHFTACHDCNHIEFKLQEAGVLKRPDNNG